MKAYDFFERVFFFFFLYNVRVDFYFFALFSTLVNRALATVAVVRETYIIIIIIITITIITQSYALYTYTNI